MKYKLIKCYPGSPKLGYITNFNENEEDWNTENLIIPPDCTDYPEFWEEVKEPIFTTEDGKDIYCGDNFWFVDNLWNIGKGLVSHPVFKPLYGYTQFSSKEAAEKYIEENKPLYSKKQVINILKGFDKEVNDYIASNKDYMEYINHYSDEEKRNIQVQ